VWINPSLPPRTARLCKPRLSNHCRCSYNIFLSGQSPISPWVRAFLSCPGSLHWPSWTRPASVTSHPPSPSYFALDG
jgi:hypothetical protein